MDLQDLQLLRIIIITWYDSTVQYFVLGRFPNAPWPITYLQKSRVVTD